MEKLLSFRIEKAANEKILGQINHDMRIGHIPKYINKDKMKDNLLLTGEKLNKKSYEELLKEQNKRSKRKIQKNTERFFKGIMTFSKEMTQDYKSNPDMFKECSIEFIKKIEDKYQLQISYSELHLDETTPHIHLLFDNISKVNGKSIRRNINPKILSEIQTEMGIAFSKMGYQRGIEKSITNAEHFKFQDYTKLKEEVESLKKDIEGLKNDGKDLEKLFNKIIEQKELTESEIENLKVIAPSLFQFVDKASQKQKQELSNQIQKTLTRKI